MFFLQNFVITSTALDSTNTSTLFSSPIVYASDTVQLATKLSVDVSSTESHFTFVIVIATLPNREFENVATTIVAVERDIQHAGAASDILANDPTSSVVDFGDALVAVSPAKLESSLSLGSISGAEKWDVPLYA